MTAFYLTLFKPTRPGEAEWHLEWPLCDREETVNAICGGDFADFKVSRVLYFAPPTEGMTNGICCDVTAEIAKGVCDLTHDKQYRPDANTRDFLEAHGFDGWFQEAA